MNVGIYIYDDAEVMDFSGPFEVFSTASRFMKKKEKFNVFLVSEENRVVQARGGFNVLAQHSFSDCPDLDVLIVAGGVHTEEMKKQNVLDWIKEQSKKVHLTASVCTGVFILAAAKVVKKQKVTTHWEDIQDLKESFPKLNVKENRRWIDEDNIVTSGGITAGVDMSLYLVKKLHSKQLAIDTAKQMEFVWTKN